MTKMGQKKKPKPCKHCGGFNHLSLKCWQRPKTKKQLEYEEWRDEVAKPYLIEKFGEVCAACGGARCGNRQLDLDHKLNRGSHHNLKRTLTNVQLLGREPCHREKTDRVNGLTKT